MASTGLSIETLGSTSAVLDQYPLSGYGSQKYPPSYFSGIEKGRCCLWSHGISLLGSMEFPNIVGNLLHDFNVDVHPWSGPSS